MIKAVVIQFDKKPDPKEFAEIRFVLSQFANKYTKYTFFWQDEKRNPVYINPLQEAENASQNKK